MPTVVQAFTTSDIFVPPVGVSTVDVLVVAGGGGGAHRAPGGAGGLVFRPQFEVSGPVNIIVGSGGAANLTPNDSVPSYADNGGDSSFGTIIAKGGGGGSRAANGKDGGSGGAGDGSSSTPYDGGQPLQPSQSPPSNGYGFKGGHNYPITGRPTGGGGGAGGVGQTPTSPNGGHGGPGLYEVTLDDIVYNFADLFGTQYGEIVNGEAWFAGGGGGGSTSAQSNGTGGNGGGGDGIFESVANGNNGLAYTGGGGGNRANGGSGIVLVSYEDPAGADGPGEITGNLYIDQAGLATGGTMYAVSGSGQVFTEEVSTSGAFVFDGLSAGNYRVWGEVTVGDKRYTTQVRTILVI